MSLQSLDKKLRKQLETTIIKARNVAETAARIALKRLYVGDNKPVKLDVQVFPSHCHQTLTFTQQNNTLMMLLALSALNLCQSYVFLMHQLKHILY